jgi:phage terminase small subunit
MSLTAKQQSFINEYFKDFNAKEAAIRAGYSEASAHSIGWENLNKPYLRQEIDRRIELYSMGANERLTVLSDIARAKEEKTADRLKAIEMLGKLAGDYTEKIEHSGKIDVRSLSDEELKAIARGGDL